MEKFNNEEVRFLLQEALLTDEYDIADILSDEDDDAVMGWLNSADYIMIEASIKSFEKVERYELCARLLKILKYQPDVEM